jgi:hypothetical protein
VALTILLFSQSAKNIGESASIIAILWHHRPACNTLSSQFSDPENLPKTFEEWFGFALLAEGHSGERAGDDRDSSNARGLCT